MRKMHFLLIAVFSLCVLLLLSAAPAACAQEMDLILAERVETGDLKSDDQIVIVSDASGKALSTQPAGKNGTNLGPSDIVKGNTATREVLTGMGEDIAVFEVIPMEGGIRLKCKDRYLTSGESGSILSLESEPNDYSLWQFVEGKYLYNPNAAYSSDHNQYLEFYPNGNFFSTFEKTERSGAYFPLSFYRLGNSLPEEPLIFESYYVLPVFETSDVHGYLAETSSEPYLYLLAEISDKVKDVRGYGQDARNDLAVLLDGGDIYQGIPLSNRLNGQSLAAAYQIMGYDAVTIGNHEFDWGIEVTVDADATMMDSRYEGFTVVNEVPVIISNLFRNGEKVPFAHDYVILEKTAKNQNGEELAVHIGVIGFAGEYSSSIVYDRFTGDGFTISEDYDALNELAAELEGSGLCDATIVLAHHEATEVALGLGENTSVDLVLGGHTHTNIAGATEGGLSYLEPKSFGKAYGYAELAFSAEDGAPVFQKVSKAQTVSVAGLPNTAENADELDPELVELTDKVLAALDDILSQKIGTILSPVQRLTYLPDSGNRSSTAGNWQSSIIARIAGADIGFVNGGSLRVEFEWEETQNGRDITLSDVYTMFPFDNTIYCYELTWEDLLAALEYSMTGSGARLLTDVSGINVYYTDNTVRAIVTPEGLAVYANGEWRDGWKVKTVSVGLSNYIATTNRISEDGLSNPFVAWNETERLIRSNQIDSECAIEVLTEEASMNGGILSFDTTAHFINREYAGSVSDPAGTLARGMIVTILHRMEGEPKVPYSGVFADVPDGQRYTDGVEWAASVGIVLGYGDGTCGVMDNVTREQLAAMLYRYAEYKGYDVGIGENTNIRNYDDALDISGWAMPAMQWACGTGVLNSDKASTICPTEPANEDVIAHAIRIFCESVAK